jgi:hypothetical protein
MDRQTHGHTDSILNFTCHTAKAEIVVSHFFPPRNSIWIDRHTDTQTHRQHFYLYIPLDTPKRGFAADG